VSLYGSFELGSLLLPLRRRSMVGGQWSVNGQWSVVGGQWSVSGRWLMVSGQWSMVSGQSRQYVTACL